MPVRDFWTITLAIFVCITTTYIGYRTLEWVLTNAGFMHSISFGSHQRAIESVQWVLS